MLRNRFRGVMAVALVGATAFLPACSKAGVDIETSGGPMPITLEALEGTWQTSSAQGTDGPIELERPAVLRIQGDGSFTIDAGCNNLGGTFSVDGTQLASTPLRSTRMACSEPIASFEYLVSEVLDDITVADLRGEDELMVESPAGEVQFYRG